MKTFDRVGVVTGRCSLYLDLPSIRALFRNSGRLPLPNFGKSGRIRRPLRNYALKMSTPPVYKIIFHNGKQIFEVFAKHIYQSDMWGFVEIEELLFGERSAILVDPAEEKLKAEFSDVKRSYIPMQSIIRIDEVEKRGAAKISEGSDTGKVANFPLSPSVSPGNVPDE